MIVIRSIGIECSQKSEQIAWPDSCTATRNSSRGLSVGLQAESDGLTTSLGQAAQAAGQQDARAWAESRPPFTEVEPVRRALYLAGQTGADAWIHIRAELLHRLRRAEDLPHADDDPAAAVRRFDAALLDGDEAGFAERMRGLFVTGTPQFDFHFRPEFFRTREEFCSKVSADPSRPIVLYTTGMDNHMPEEARVIEGVYETLRRMGNGRHELTFPGVGGDGESMTNKQDAGP